MSVVAASIKLLNIPCMFDLGTSPVNPCDEQLNLNMIDDVTFHTIMKKELKKDSLMP